MKLNTAHAIKFGDVGILGRALQMEFGISLPTEALYRFFAAPDSTLVFPGTGGKFCSISTNGIVYRNLTINIKNAKIILFTFKNGTAAATIIKEMEEAHVNGKG